MEAQEQTFSPPTAVPAPAQAAPEPQRFGASQRALGQRRALLWALKGVLFGILLILSIKFQPDSLWAIALKWALFAGMSAGLWYARGRFIMDPLLERELTLHAHALELRRGSFRRFVVFENLRHIHVVQGSAGERLLSIRVDTDDDSILLHGFDGMPEAFAAIVGAKPDRTLIEIDQQRIDWAEPLPWALSGAALALLLGGILLASWETPQVVKASGKLLLLNALAYGIWRPFSRGQHWSVRSSEIACLLALAGIGYLLA
jgi:hypothetical protein